MKHMRSGPALPIDEFDPEWWTSCGEIVEGAEAVEDEALVDCAECLELLFVDES